MSNLKHLRMRIKSIIATQKVTKAMQLVSVSKLKKVRTDIPGAILYKNSMLGIISNIVADNELQSKLSIETKFLNGSSSKCQLLVLITSERGLCGSFNSSIIKSFKRKVIQLTQDGSDFRLIIVGRKGYDALKGLYSDRIEKYFNISKLNQDLVLRELQSKIVEFITSGKVDSCFLFFNKFNSVISYDSIEEQIIPAHHNSNLDPSATSNSAAEFEYEGEDVIQDSINLYISACLNYGLVNSNASQEAARMTAMDSATKIIPLNLLTNQQRVLF